MFETIDWYGLVLPFGYMIVLSGALMTFSSIYRKRRAGTSSHTSNIHLSM